MAFLVFNLPFKYKRMQKQIILCALFIFCIKQVTIGQISKEDSITKKFFIGSSFFMLGNVLSEKNKPDFVQLNLGYRVSEKDVLSLELKTWKYSWSLGIPVFSNSFEAPEEEFPGYIREYGLALAYQRYWWKGLYTAIHVMHAKQNFVDKNHQKIKNGYQMFNTYRLGYHFNLFNNKFFIEPSMAVTHRPIQTKMPDEFDKLNGKWPNYLIGEPGLHFGFYF